LSACRVCGVLLDDLDAAICEACLANGNGGDHGVRRTYQIGCHCDPCTHANTAYSAQYRQALRTGRPPLGAHVAAPEASRARAALADLVAEGYRPAAIAARLGLRRRGLPHFRVGMTWRSLRRILRVHADWTT